MAQISSLPRGSRDPDVGLHLLLAVHVVSTTSAWYTLLVVMHLPWSGHSPASRFALGQLQLLSSSFGTAAASTFLLCLATTCLMLGQVRKLIFNVLRLKVLPIKVPLHLLIKAKNLAPMLVSTLIQ